MFSSYSYNAGATSRGGGGGKEDEDAMETLAREFDSLVERLGGSVINNIWPLIDDRPLLINHR